MRGMAPPNRLAMRARGQPRAASAPPASRSPAGITCTAAPHQISSEAPKHADGGGRTVPGQKRYSQIGALLRPPTWATPAHGEPAPAAAGTRGPWAARAASAARERRRWSDVSVAWRVFAAGRALNQPHGCGAAGLLGLIKAGRAVCVCLYCKRGSLRRWRRIFRRSSEKVDSGDRSPAPRKVASF